jgi:ketosteroid isomerase-like protein
LEQPALCSLARAWVDHSNAHDLDAIARLLASQARYEYANSCAWEGRDAIVGMLRTIFADLPDVQWDTTGYQEISPGRVAFDFRMQATARDGGPIAREGREVIEFAEGGLITLIRVGGRHAAPTA